MKYFLTQSMVQPQQLSQVPNVNLSVPQPPQSLPPTNDDVGKVAKFVHKLQIMNG